MGRPNGVCPSRAGLESRDGARCLPPPLLHPWRANVDAVPLQLPPCPTAQACCRQCLVPRWPQDPGEAATQFFSLMWSPLTPLQEGDGGGWACADREGKGWMGSAGLTWRPSSSSSVMSSCLVWNVLSITHPGALGLCVDSDPFPPSCSPSLGCEGRWATRSPLERFSIEKSASPQCGTFPGARVSQQGGEALPCPG